MNGYLIHIWGPISLYPFGLIIAFGLIIILSLLYYDKKRQKILCFDDLITITCIAILSGLIGGRALFLIEHWKSLKTTADLFALWQGGVSLLGTVCGILLTIPWYLLYKKIPILPFFDAICVYAPLLQGIARIGCYVTGCCYGAPCLLPWAISYNVDNVFAPSEILLHPSQLYSALMLGCIFIFLYCIRYKLSTIPGRILSVYLLLIGAERFITDFFRGDREFFMHDTAKWYFQFSFHQYGALIVMSIGFLLLMKVTYCKQYKAS